MPRFEPWCPKCDKRMVRGHIPDVAHGQVVQSAWVAGIPEKRRFIGGIKYRSADLVPISAFRCPSCGLLELYARTD